MNRSAPENDDDARLLSRAAGGDRVAAEDLFSRHHQRLMRMVRLRLNHRIQGRIDSQDILQEAYMEASQRLAKFAEKKPLPFYLWLRRIVSHKLIDAHRRHLGAQARDAGQEISLHRGGLPQADSVSLAALLLGRLTSPSQAAVRAETRLQVQEALNRMNPLDREILALRHFEQLKNNEVAHVLEIDESTASTRYLRALKRLKEDLSEISELAGNSRAIEETNNE